MASEKLVADILARIEDLEEKVNHSQDQFNDVKETTSSALGIANEALETASKTSSATNALSGAAEVQTKVFIPKLVPFTSENDDIRLYIKRFESYAETLNLNEEQQVSEFIAHGRGPIEPIVLTKDLDTWKIQDLKETVLLRLSPKWDMNQMEQELYKIQVDENDDPDTVMNKVEQVLIKRDPEIQIPRLRQTQFHHFVRLIHIHEPMHTFVLNELKTSTDPDQALKSARKYLRTKGNDVTYIRHLVHKTLKDAGIPTKDVDASIFPLCEKFTFEPRCEPKCEPRTQTTNPLKSNAEETTTVSTMDSTKIMQVQDAKDQITKEYLVQFIQKNEKFTQQHMNQRFNDLEQMIQDVHEKLLQDHLKREVQQKTDENRTCISSEPQSEPKSRFGAKTKKSKRCFEKNENGKEKRYKKRFIEESDGIRAQYTTDESEDETSKEE